MGAKTWMLVYADTDAAAALKAHPVLDRTASALLAQRLFPGETLTPLEDGSLDYTNPPDNELLVGVFRGVTVLAAKEFALDYPSRLDTRFLEAAAGRTVHVYGMHSVVDWFAYARWAEGRLVRAISLSPDDGVIEDIGEKLPEEAPYWAGAHSMAEEGEDPEDAYPLPFHPLEFGEEILLATLGFQYEGSGTPELDPDDITLMHYKRG